ncbi:MAG: hypothetical protein ACE367_20300 [Acidimicrobiales bacterium]
MTIRINRWLVGTVAHSASLVMFAAVSRWDDSDDLQPIGPSMNLAVLAIITVLPLAIGSLALRDGTYLVLVTIHVLSPPVLFSLSTGGRTFFLLWWMFHLPLLMSVVVAIDRNVKTHQP